jgi:hypothetical protein
VTSLFPSPWLSKAQGILEMMFFDGPEIQNFYVDLPGIHCGLLGKCFCFAEEYLTLLRYDYGDFFVY